MIRNSFFILVFLVFHVVRAKTLQVDVREKAQELLSELRLTVNNSGKGIQVAYAGKELKARGVSNGDYLVSVNGVNAVPSVSLSAWIEGLGETRTGGVGVLPLVEVDDTIGEGPTVTDGYPLNGFIRIEVVPLSDATILSFSCSGTYPHEEHLKAEADNEQEKISRKNLDLQSDKMMKQEPVIVKEEGTENLGGVTRGSILDETEHWNEYQGNPQVSNRRPSDKAAVHSSTKNQHQAGEGFVYAAVFDEVGPMGIIFNMTAEETTVAQVIPGSPAHKLGVHVGDVIVFVNDHDCSGLGSSSIGKMVMEAEWPRTLVFRVPETISEPEAQRLSLYVYSPKVIRGIYEVQTPVGWGGNLTSGSSTSLCEPAPIVAVSSEFSCKRGGTLKPLPSPNATSVIVLVRRGACSFVDKAANVQQFIDEVLHGAGSKGRGSMVLINTKEEYADMPAGTTDTTGIHINAAMMLPSGGFQIFRVLNWEKGINIRAALAPRGACSAFLQERATNINDSDTHDKNGEILVMSSQGKEGAFRYKLAEFGSTAPKFPVTIIPADPSDACDVTSLRVRVAGSFVIVQRGGCTFGHKAHAMQKAGAAGIIITNSDDSTLHMQGSQEDARTITIPCIMVPNTLWQWVTNQVTPQNDIIGRLYPSSSQ